MKAIVTGANGFLGSHLVDRLLSDGVEVVSIVRPTADLQNLEGSKTRYLKMNLNEKGFNSPAFIEELKTADWVFHVAAATNAYGPEFFYESNVKATLDLANACIQYAPTLKRFVFVSSQAALGPAEDGKSSYDLQAPRPLTQYGKSKLQAETELATLSSKLNWIGIRPPAIFGPREVEFAKVIQMAARGVFPVLGGRKQKLSICYVSDVVEALVLAAKSDSARAPSGTCLLVGDLTKPTAVELGQTIGSHFGKKTLTIPIPRGLLFGIAGMNELIGKMRGTHPFVNRDKIQELTHSNWSVDDSRARSMIGYQAKVPLSEGVAKTVEWSKRKLLK